MSKTPRRRQARRGFRSGGLPARLKLLLYPGAVIAVSAVLFLAAYVFLSKDASPVPVAERESSLVPRVSSELASGGDTSESLRGLLRLHGRSLGLEGANSLALNGSYRSGNQNYQLFILAKRPELVRHAIRGTDTIVSAAHDGDDTWLEFSLGDLPAQRRAIDPLNARILRLECHIPALVWHFEDDLTEGLHLAGTIEIDGKVLQVVENTGFLDVPVVHYLDPETGLEQIRRASVPVGDRVSDVEIRYGPYLAADGVRWPSSYEVLLNGERVCTATVESARVNAGVVPMLFQPRASRSPGSVADPEGDS